MLVMPADLDLEQDIGVFVVGDFFVGQEAGESFLEGVEAAFDFSFGGSIGSDAVSGAQGGESALELGVGIEPVGWSSVTEEREAIGVEAGGQANSFDGCSQVSEVIPSGVAANEGAGEDFAGMIVQSEDEHRIVVCGPPRVG